MRTSFGAAPEAAAAAVSYEVKPGGSIARAAAVGNFSRMDAKQDVGNEPSSSSGYLAPGRSFGSRPISHCSTCTLMTSPLAASTSRFDLTAVGFDFVLDFFNLAGIERQYPSTGLVYRDAAVLRNKG